MTTHPCDAGAHCRDCNDLNCPGDKAALKFIRLLREAKREIRQLKKIVKALQSKTKWARRGDREPQEAAGHVR
jgi:hypothetical protein